MRNALAMSDESERLAKALMEFREARGISVSELARRTQLSQATIRLHESDRGRPPVPFAARRFEEVLGWVPGSIPSTAHKPTDREPPPDSSPVTGQVEQSGLLAARRLIDEGEQSLLGSRPGFPATEADDQRVLDRPAI